MLKRLATAQIERALGATHFLKLEVEQANMVYNNVVSFEIRLTAFKHQLGAPPS